MGEILGAVTAFLGTAIAGTSATYGGLLYTAALGATAYTAATASSAPSSAGTVGQVTDKTEPQAAEQLDAAELGDEESEKRKRQSAKAKFKIDKDAAAIETPAETGVQIEATPTKTTGVQI